MMPSSLLLDPTKSENEEVKIRGRVDEYEKIEQRVRAMTLNLLQLLN